LNLLGMTDREIIAYNMNKLRIRYADGKYSDAQANARADKVPQPVPAPAPAPAPAPLPMGNRKFMGQQQGPQPAVPPETTPYMRSVMQKAAAQEAQGNTPVAMTEAEKLKLDNEGERPEEVHK
jgi:hypothetical protein